ncbi:hypothetical protein HZI73_22290 [Vallitalea pronyensis]|uniref:Uncharacterized protein n=1 Tax=Vallitalea pronyensis TaxID=1348613 RepID=A0A8J8MNU6_9FIRM|nr:hypothetical protein [Vallitalea pronyensis]QUI24861.1 hypothetical protein HZI73_22290 [Vallitalea pronyensis]
MNKKEKERLIEKNLYEKMNELSTLIHREYKNISNEYCDQGLLNSGTFNSAILDMVNKNTLVNCQETLNIVLELQKELNFTYTEKDIIFIQQQFINRYNGYIIGVFERKMKDGSLKLHSYEMTSRTIELTKNSLKANTNSLVNSTIEENRLKKRLRKDNKAIRQSRFANIIALLAFIISVISLIISLYKI